MKLTGNIFRSHWCNGLSDGLAQKSRDRGTVTHVFFFENSVVFSAFVGKFHCVLAQFSALLYYVFALKLLKYQRISVHFVKSSAQFSGPDRLSTRPDVVFFQIHAKLDIIRAVIWPSVHSTDWSMTASVASPSMETDTSAQVITNFRSDPPFSPLNDNDFLSH